MKFDPAPDHPRKQVKHASRLQVCVVWVLSLLVRGWCRTLRFEMGKDDIAAATYRETPAVLLFWHNRLFIVPWMARCLRRDRSTYALVSASQDGAVLAAFVRFMGVRAVRGSSSRMGREALHELMAQSRAGNDVAITPDGPRGPVYSMRAGALIAARRLNVPVILYGIEYRSAWRLSSWDRFCIPKPYSRVHVRAEVVAPVRLEQDDDVLAHLRRRLLELSGESDEGPAAS